MIKEVLLKKSQEIEYIYLVYVCGIIYIAPGTIYIIPHTYVWAANQYINRYFRRDHIQKPPPDFKTLYCSWQLYSSDKHLKRTKKTDMIKF